MSTSNCHAQYRLQHLFILSICFLTSFLSHIGTVCPGGIQLPCSGRGRCIDGLVGDGTCVCDSSFNGTACERCINTTAGSCPGI